MTSHSKLIATESGSSPGDCMDKHSLSQAVFNNHPRTFILVCCPPLFQLPYLPIHPTLICEILLIIALRRHLFGPEPNVYCSLVTISKSVSFSHFFLSAQSLELYPGKTIASTTLWIEHKYFYSHYPKFIRDAKD